MKHLSKIFKDHEKQATKQWFLPHFTVTKEDRVTTKVHLVFDEVVKHHRKILSDAILPKRPRASTRHEEPLNSFPPCTCSSYKWNLRNVLASGIAERRLLVSPVPLALQESLMYMNFNACPLQTLPCHFSSYENYHLINLWFFKTNPRKIYINYLPLK